jgi:hypothetical protein
MAVAWSTALTRAAELRPLDSLSAQIESNFAAQLGPARAANRQGRLKTPHPATDYQSAWLPLSLGEPAGNKETTDRSLFTTGPAAGGSIANGSASELTPELSALRDKVRTVLAMYYPRHQSARDHSPWEVMHAIIAYGVDTQLFKNGPGGEKVNAIGWMCYNHACAGQQMLLVANDKIDARRGVGVQGHAGQFLAILAQSHVKSDFPLYVQGKTFSLTDLIEHEKETCVAGEELTFKLISLAHYLDSDATWITRDGQEWSIQRLVLEELKQPIRGAACGGTHRLMGISYSIHKRMQRNKPIVGEFVKAQTFIQGYHRYTFSLQNPDGSFSTEWFTRKGDSTDVDRRLKTSGHILEWIAYSLSDEELRDPRMIKAVNYLATILLTNDKHTWEIGPLGHGLHGLAIYSSRMFKDTPVAQPLPLVGPTGGDALEARRAGGANQPPGTVGAVFPGGPRP